MFGRFDEVDDKPGWREKLAERRASPLWVPRRPSWMAEGPGVMALLFVGIASLMIAFVYFAVPPATLPSALPGHFVIPSTTTTSSTSTTTTTTVPAASIDKVLAKTLTMSEKQRQAFWAWVVTADEFHRQQTATDLILSTTPTPPVRRWDYGFLAIVLAAAVFALAWFLSDTRSRKVWGK
jgi:hypothetical protein